MIPVNNPTLKNNISGKGFRREIRYPYRITMDNKNSPKTRQIFLCTTCDYKCFKKSDLKKHEQTIKHKKSEMDNLDNKNSPKLANANMQAKSLDYTCKCGKWYKYKSGLCKHRRQCTFIYIEDNSTKPLSSVSVENSQFISLLQQNQEFKEMILEQNKTITELSNRVSTNHITNNHTTNNNNQKFNLNFFLNTTCKDAMNMSEFIENINIDVKELENIGKDGYVSGMTNVILSRIKDLDITKRPLHCTDLKREIMYIKDNDEWCKDSPSNNKLQKMITIVAKQNYTKLPLWKQQCPESDNWQHPKYNFYVDMMRNVLGDVGDEQVKLDRKIIKNISSHILIEK